MKLNVSNELKSRLTHAAENGSVIAKDILSEVKKNVPVEEVIRGAYNFFSTKRKRTEAGTFKKIRIVFTACNKDLGQQQCGRTGHCMERDNIVEINKHTDCRLPAGSYLFLTRIRHRTDPQAGAGGRYPVATQIQRLYTYDGFHRTESH